jgi:hypothetical protein
VGVQVLTTLFMKNSVCWDITSCRLVKVNRRFRGTYRLCLHGQRAMQHRYDFFLLHSGLLVGLPFDPEGWGKNVRSKRLLTFVNLHGIISQKIESFMIKMYIILSNSYNFMKLILLLNVWCSHSCDYEDYGLL